MMTLQEIEELTTLLEGENPKSHGEWLRFKADAMYVLHQLDRLINSHVSTRVSIPVYERLMALYKRSLAGIDQYVPKPRLCLNAP